MLLSVQQQLISVFQHENARLLNKECTIYNETQKNTLAHYYIIKKSDKYTTSTEPSRGGVERSFGKMRRRLHSTRYQPVPAVDIIIIKASCADRPNGTDCTTVWPPAHKWFICMSVYWEPCGSIHTFSETLDSAELFTSTHPISRQRRFGHTHSLARKQWRCVFCVASFLPCSTLIYCQIMHRNINKKMRGGWVIWTYF